MNASRPHSIQVPSAEGALLNDQEHLVTFTTGSPFSVNSTFLPHFNALEPHWPMAGIG